MKNTLPKILNSHMLEYDINLDKLWEIEKKEEFVKVKDYEYLLHLPFWREKNSEKLFNIKPIDVIINPQISIYHYNRIINANLKYSIDFIIMPDKTIRILDGLHRLSKYFILKEKLMKVKLYNSSIIKWIKE